MDLLKIKGILSLHNLDDDAKSKLILGVIARDKNAIPYMLELLSIERQKNEELISDFNLELSRASVVLNDSNLRANKKVIIQPKKVVEMIKAHYNKWRDCIECCF